MFDKTTVFVLGAGVSAPFCFPVGQQMKDAICNGGYESTEGRHIETLPQDIMAAVIGYGMGNEDDSGVAKEFINAFRSADLYSIDAWLEANQANRYFQSAGKAAIAAVLMNAEALAVENGANVAEDWFAWLWNNMWTPEISQVSMNQVHFVTFNYDRLLEWKLQRQVKNTYLRAQFAEHAHTLEFFRKRITHVHGVLGGPESAKRLGGFGKSKLGAIRQGPGNLADEIRDYGEKVRELAKYISIVSESTLDRQTIDTAIHQIQQATLNKQGRLIFLGFSYDERNILKLELDRRIEDVDPPEPPDSEAKLDGSRIIGSARGLKPAEKATVREMFKGRIALGDDADAVAFCRAHVRVPTIRQVKSR